MAETQKSDKDETKTAGDDKSKTTQTTKQAEEKSDATPTTVEERGETDAKGAASGSVEGGVRDGDSGLDDTELDDWSEEADEDGVVGTVAEKDLEGNEYDVPYAYVTADAVGPARTSDSDDPAKDWTAQHALGLREDEDGNEVGAVALIDVEATPGQTFKVSELPNKDVAEAAGIDYAQWVSGLPVRADVENEAPRKGIPA